MGMERMFSNAAEFENLLDSDEPLKVSEVVHKAFIEVNEEGAEAAAATGTIFLKLFSFQIAKNKLYCAFCFVSLVFCFFLFALILLFKSKFFTYIWIFCFLCIKL